MNDKNIELIKSLLLATDNFVVNRPSFNLHTVIAGYPWFLDWGRDTLISFEGLLLITKRYEIAREVLLTNIRDIKYGLVQMDILDLIIDLYIIVQIVHYC